MANKETLKELKTLTKTVRGIKRQLEELTEVVTDNPFEVKFYHIKDENGCLISIIGNPGIPFKAGETINLTLGEIDEDDEEGYSFWRSYVNAGNHTKLMAFEIVAIHRNIVNESDNQFGTEEIDIIIAPMSRRVLIEKTN